MDNGLNQIGIKIDMYRQEHRLSPATPIFRRFDVQLAVPSEAVNFSVSMEEKSFR